MPTAESVALVFPEAEIRSNPDLLLAEIDGCVVGYNHVLWRWTEVNGTRVYLHLGYLLPPWRGKRIGSALLHWAQQRIRDIVADERPDGPTTFATNVSSTEREADALIQHEGYVAVRRLSDMVLEPLTRVPVPPLPQKVTLRPLEPDHYRAVYGAWKDAFAQVWTSTPPSEEDYQEFVADNFAVPSFDPALCQIAWADDQVVGLVLARVRKGVGFHNLRSSLVEALARVRKGVGVIPEVAVRRAWQRHGIARSLMVYALNALYDDRITQVRIATDADDGQGARSLYERLGFRERKQHIFYRKPFSN